MITRLPLTFYYTPQLRHWRRLSGLLVAWLLPACFWQNETRPEPEPAELTFTTTSVAIEHGPSVRLSWQTSEISEHVTFTVEREADQSKTYLLLGRTAITSYVDSKVEWDKTYRYRLTALDKKNRALATSPPIVAVVGDTNRLSIAIEQQPPAVTSATTASIRFSSNKPAEFECSLDDQAWQACSESWTVFDLGEGEHLARIKASAAAETSTVQIVWRVDLTPPEVYLLATPPATAFAAAAQFEFAANEPCRYLCSLDGAAANACQSPWQVAIEAGQHVAAISCVDLAGNASVSAATHHWQIQLPLWSLTLAGLAKADLVVLAPATAPQLLVARGDQLRQIDAATGAELQAAPLPTSATSLAAISANSILYAAAGGERSGAGLADFAPLWQFSLAPTEALLPPLFVPPFAAQPTAIVWPSRPHGVGALPGAQVGLAAIAATNGNELWRHSLGGGAAAAAAASQTTAGWMIFAGGRYGDFYALDASTGVSVWQTWLPMPLATPPLVVTVGASQHVWSASGDGYVYAFEATSGQVLIAQPTPDLWPAVQHMAANEFAAGATQIIIASAGGRVAAILAASGETAWLSDVLGPISAAPVVANVGGSTKADIIVGCSDGAVVSLDGENGQELWRFWADAQIDRLAAVTGNDESTHLVAIDANGQMFALPTAAIPSNIVWPQSQFNAARQGSP